MLSYNINKIMEKLKPSEKDELYKELWFEHIKKDVVVFASSNHIPVNSQMADAVARELVLQSGYNFDISYWDNIRSVLNDFGRGNQI